LKKNEPPQNSASINNIAHSSRPIAGAIAVPSRFEERH
jgi:hypothetical protein